MATLASCAGDGVRVEAGGSATTTAPADATTTTTTAVGVAIEPLDLEAALLTVDDLPPGYVSQPTTDDSGADDFVCGGEDPTDAILPIDEVEAMFAQSESGPFVFQAVGLFAREDADELLRTMGELGNDCQSTTTDAGTTTENSMVPIPFPAIGDATVAFHVTSGLSDGSMVFAGDIVFWRDGDTVLGLGSLGLAGGEPTGFTTQQLIDLVDLTQERFEATSA